MSAALTAFMDTLIDYAGLFPPAQLAVPAAVAEFARHRGEAEAWMLGRFIAPAERLAEIGATAAPLYGMGPVWGFSVLVGHRESPAAALAALREQARLIGRFEAEHGGRVAVQCLETPVPPVGAATAPDFVPALLARLAAVGLGGRDLFLELPAGRDDAALLRVLANTASALAGTAGGFLRIGAKLRCGGVKASDFPTCERVAAVIGLCAELDLPLKCTAGLHHPVRHRAQEPDVMMHGFLNVFGAGLLAWSGTNDPAVLLGCVTETEARAFTFTDEAFVWRGHSVDLASLRRIRSRSLCGFGSCSFAEPRADLQSLGVL
jgi:hypothetical protein